MELQKLQQEKEAALLFKQQQAENKYGARLETFFKEAPAQPQTHQQPLKAAGDAQTLSSRIVQAVQTQLPPSQQQEPYSKLTIQLRLEHIKSLVQDRFPLLPPLKAEKNIIIEDSCRQITGSFALSKTTEITGRNPFKPDHAAVNYDLDSEEELAEAQGEDLVSNAQKRDSDDVSQDDEAQMSDDGFLVSDFHLSDEEYHFSNFDENADTLDKRREIELRRQIYRDQVHLREKRLEDKAMPCILPESVSALNTAVCFAPLQFPLRIAKAAKEAPPNDRQILEEFQFELLRLAVGTVEGKQAIIDAFCERHCGCSKKAVDALLKECTVKEKREPDDRVCYYVSHEHFRTLTLEEQHALNALNEERMRPFREEAALEKQKRQQELELKELQKELQRKEREDQELQKREERLRQKEQLQCARQHKKQQQLEKLEQQREHKRLQKEQRKLHKLEQQAAVQLAKQHKKAAAAKAKDS